MTASQREAGNALLGAVGEVAWVEDEALIDPVTAVSGSGPAYIFLLAEAMTKVRTLGTESATKFVSSLTDDQKALYKELTGKKFEGKIDFTPRRPQGDKE